MEEQVGAGTRCLALFQARQQAGQSSQATSPPRQAHLQLLVAPLDGCQVLARQQRGALLEPAAKEWRKQQRWRPSAGAAAAAAEGGGGLRPCWGALRDGSPVTVLPELRQRVLKHLVLLGAAGRGSGRA